MDLVTQLQDLKGIKTVKRPVCTFVSIFDNLVDDEAPALREALDNLTIRHSDLANALNAQGYQVKGITVARHRNRGKANGCRCEA